MTPDEVVAYLQPRVRVEGECWEWRLSFNGGGCPVATVDGKRARSVRRWVWICCHPGATIGTRQVVPSCDNKACVRPEHLSSLLPTQVNKWIARRGGFSTQARRIACRKSGRASSPLTIDDVRAIRARRCSGETLTAISKDYPVDLSAIARICRNESWHDPANPFAGLVAS